jgi:hypothetical protein
VLGKSKRETAADAQTCSGDQSASPDHGEPLRHILAAGLIKYAG